ncbi:hypothetical protein O9992_26220 [Vibrio lentus]|nr:hypothetical protein [Vibrio lentus]
MDHLLTYINPYKLSPMKVVVNAGNGVAGHVIDALEERFQQTQMFLYHLHPRYTMPLTENFLMASQTH